MGNFPVLPVVDSLEKHAGPEKRHARSYGNTCPRSVVVARYSVGLRHALEFLRALEDGATLQLPGELTLNCLPRRLWRRAFVAALQIERMPSRFQLSGLDQHVASAPLQVDADAISGAQEREPAQCC